MTTIGRVLVIIAADIADEVRAIGCARARVHAKFNSIDLCARLPIVHLQTFVVRASANGRAWLI